MPPRILTLEPTSASGLDHYLHTFWSFTSPIQGTFTTGSCPTSDHTLAPSSVSSSLPQCTDRSQNGMRQSHEAKMTNQYPAWKNRLWPSPLEDSTFNESRETRDSMSLG